MDERVESTAGAVSARTILLIDDDPSIRELASLVLRQAGYQVLLADGGPEGLMLFQTSQPVDLVILDLTMPEITGWEVLRALIAREPDVRVLLSSGYSGESADESLPPQVRGLLPKPYRPADLIAQVQAILGESR